MRPWQIAVALILLGSCLLFIPLLLLNGVDKSRVAVMGQWTGGYYADGAEVLRGWLQLYRTGDKFKMRLANKDQEIRYEGTWKIAKQRIELNVVTIDFENPTEENQKALGLHVLKPELVRDAYAKPLVLDLSQDQIQLKGLTMTLDKIQGRHEFKKGGVTANTRKALDQIQGK